jgi:uncharacterized protein YbjT (DUF2867 family)
MPTSRTSDIRPILVTAGTGKTGRRVAARLWAAGRPVRIGSRRGRPPFDWHDRSTWGPALEGAGAAYLAYSPDVGFPGAAEVVGDVAAAAVDTGVHRLVLLSGRGEAGAQRAERLVQASGAAWTVVQAAVFAQNFTEGAFADTVAAGVLPMPVDDVPEPFVDVDDIADVAAAALLDERHAGQVYEVTGPRLVTFTDVLDAIGGLTGTPARYVRVSADEMAGGLQDAGLSAVEAAQLVEVLRSVLDGRNAHLADGVARALGRPPRDVLDVLDAWHHGQVA